jgi:hypothetical protein
MIFLGEKTMKKRITSLVVIFISIIAIIGCETKKEQEKKTSMERHTTSTEETSGMKVVARVNGKPIYEEELHGRPLEEVIDEEILYQEGLRRGLDKQFEKRIENFKRKLIVDELKREILKDLSEDYKISEEEIKSYYEKNRDKFRLMQLKGIMTSDKSLAEEIRKRLLEGEEPEQIASDYSKSGKEVILRDYRWTNRYNKLFEGKGVGAVSDVIEQHNRFIVIKLMDQKEVPIDQVRQTIIRELIAEKRKNAVKEYAEKLKKENNIQVEIIEGSK